MADKARRTLGYKYYNRDNSDKEKKDILKKSKKFILIIDEINRADLSELLGELVYALEYRDEAIKSIYKGKDYVGSQTKTKDIILPSNFYIIGTMSTVNRNLKDIDYNISRRFAIIDILSELSHLIQ